MKDFFLRSAFYVHRKYWQVVWATATLSLSLPPHLPRVVACLQGMTLYECTRRVIICSVVAIEG